MKSKADHGRSSSLSLTAAFYSGRLNSNLILLQSSVQAISTRVIVQSALQRYDNGNDTDENWVRTQMDIGSAISGVGTSALLLQARVVSKNGSGIAGPYGLVNVTGESALGQIPLPFAPTNGTPVYLGDDGLGYPPNLYPNLTYTSTVINSTFNESNAFFDGNPLYRNSSLFLGPWLVNETFALCSITMPIINNTSSADVLGWITVVVNAQLLLDVERSIVGLGNTGEVLIVGQTTPDNKLPPDLKLTDGRIISNKTLAKELGVQFVFPPLRNLSRSDRHPSRIYGHPNSAFDMKEYPAVFEAFTKYHNQIQNAGSIISTRNEENKAVSVGFALPVSPMVDWAVLIEQSHEEVTAPIHRLRNVLVACVFGTTGLLLLLVFPIAHLSIRPIRRLREATKRTVEPYRYPSDNESHRSSISEDESRRSDVEDEAVEARKEGFMGRLSNWRNGRHKSQAERRERLHRRTFRIPAKVQDRKHFIHDELTDLTKTFNEMSEELMMQYERLEERVKERTQELEISKRAAEAANESKTLFIANISHELKTPLNGILGMTAVCMQEEDQTKIKRSLGIIYKSGDLLLHLLTDLLTFSKNQIGQQLALDEREFRLADVSSQVLSIFEKQAKDGAINLTVDFQGPNEGLGPSSGAPLQSDFGPYGTGRVKDMFLWGDQHRILQVIINLVSNSLKFTPPDGSVQVRIRCVGEAIERAESRKGSLLSKQSKQSKQGSSKEARRRGRVTSNSNSSTSPAIKAGEKGRYSDTALQINGGEPKSIPTIAIRERSSSPPPPNARVLIFEFEVEDTGPGIPESQQQRVFEPFVQGDLGLSKKYGGTGLGLSICSQLASLMKGSITLKSQEGVGSTFTMRIPVFFTKERADSTASSNVNGSRRNSLNIPALKDESNTLHLNGSTSDLSLEGADGALDGFGTPAKPRLVGLSQPFFAATSPLESTEKQLAAMERVAAQASRSGHKVRVLVAEDNKVNQEVVLRMLKLEDIYGRVSSIFMKTITHRSQMSPLRRTAKRHSSSSKRVWLSENFSISSSWMSRYTFVPPFFPHLAIPLLSDSGLTNDFRCQT